MTLQSWFAHETASSVDQFFDMIEEFVSHQRLPGLWRGEADHRVPLVAAAFRKTGREKIRLLARSSGYPSFDNAPVGKQIYELSVVAEFYRRANRQGLPLPPVSNEYHQVLAGGPRGILTDAFGDARLHEEYWPPRELWPLFALAQHYGIPTRMLDWSDDPMVALYFAARNSLRLKQCGGQSFSLWWGSIEVPIALSALRPFRIGRMSDPLPGHGAAIYLVDAPYYGNANLAAQAGRFTLSCVAPRSPIASEDYGLKEVLDLSIEFNGYLLPKDSVLLKRVSIGADSARKVLSRLQRKGYDAGRLFPGLSGCVSAMEDHLLISASEPGE